MATLMLYNQSYVISIKFYNFIYVAYNCRYVLNLYALISIGIGNADYTSIICTNLKPRF